MSVWMPGCTIHVGPPSKIGYPSFGRSGLKRGTTWHSAEGPIRAIVRVIDNVERRASFQYAVEKNGKKWQFYPNDFHCWHAGDIDDDGGVRANIDLDAIEFEGFAGEPLTPEQYKSGIEITRFNCEQRGFTTEYELYVVGRIQHEVWMLAEHNQLSNLPTACPSNRVNWIIPLHKLNQEEDMGFARIISIKGDRPSYKSYLWREGRELVHMKNTTQRKEVAKLFDISEVPTRVSRSTLKAVDA